MLAAVVRQNHLTWKETRPRSLEIDGNQSTQRGKKEKGGEGGEIKRERESDVSASLSARARIGIRFLPVYFRRNEMQPAREERHC